MFTCHLSVMKEIKHIEEVNWDLLAKVLSDEASVSEKAEVEAWAGQPGENGAVLKSADEIMKKSRLYYRNRRFDPAAAWEKIEGELQESKPVRPLTPSQQPVRQRQVVPLRRRFLQVAASLLLAVALSALGYYAGFRQHETAVFTEVISNDQQVLRGITLPDGTLVTLNNNSKLTWPRQFTGEVREVSIEGEAFFEVHPDASKPFVITAGDARVRVLGTSFNVCARPGDKTVEVVVETGKVEVTAPRLAQEPGRSLLLLPGEKGVLFQEARQLVKSVNDNPNVTAWKTNELVFEQKPLGDVIADLEKTYHTEIQLSDPALAELLLTAHFSQQPVEFILEVIRLTFNLELSAQNGQYFLTAVQNHPLKQKP